MRYEVFTQQPCRTVFTTRFRWVARLACWMRRNWDYAPAGWGWVDNRTGEL